ncbi:hypothetical protein [Cytobacillus sp. IB215316]|uniref:hypothetical protein n=1 Tax=Cytobacillus sp. IB215316 TaxID=3097354 RepID=UPI002A0CB2A8|nr:hypothetical protein [Cytobacillus sp. IB215316]MDX8363220.1 hypothetical protein [Cytobacillus sp. IB215316]
MGQGTAGGFINNNIVVSEDTVITKLVFSTRNNTLRAGDTVTCTIFKDNNTCATVLPMETPISATVMGPSPGAMEPFNCCAIAQGNVPVSQWELLSVRINSTGATTTLPGGVTARLSHNNFYT